MVDKRVNNLVLSNLSENNVSTNEENECPVLKNNIQHTYL